MPVCVPTVISRAYKPGLTLPGCKLKSEENSAWVQLCQFYERLIRGRREAWKIEMCSQGSFKS